MATAFAKPSTVRAQAARSQRLRRASRSVVRAAASAPPADGEAVKLAKTFGLEGLEEVRARLCAAQGQQCRGPADTALPRPAHPAPAPAAAAPPAGRRRDTRRAV